MKTLRNTYNIYATPSLFIHELSHAIVALLMFRGVTGIMVHRNRTEGKIYGLVVLKSGCRNRFEQVLFSMAPLFSILFFLLMGIFVSNMFLFVTLYQLTTPFVSLPSSGDIDRMVKFEEYRKMDREGSGYTEAYFNKMEHEKAN